MFPMHTTYPLPTRVAAAHLSSLNISRRCRLPTRIRDHSRKALEEILQTDPHTLGCDTRRPIWNECGHG